MASKISIDSTQIRQVLKLWDSAAQLGQHPLAQLDCVAHKLAKQTQGITEIGRGMALKEVLHAAIQTLRPNDGSPQTQQKAWYAYLIITERYYFGRLPEWIMVHLSISSRSFYREMKTGTEAIASFLRHAEHQAEMQATHLPSPLTNLSQPAQPAIFLPPDLPSHSIVGREQLLVQVAAQLIEPQGQRVALHGLPGVGKTTAASTLIDNERLNANFSDGIIWINIGPEPDAGALLGLLATQVGLTDIQIRKSTPQSLADLVRAQLANKKQLFILDDVWQLADAEPLCLGGRQTAYLITTRLPAVGVQFAGKNLFTVPELDQTQSETLLNDLAPNIIENEFGILLTLQRITGGLPLALVIFGRYLQSQGYHGQQRRLQAAVERLSQRAARLELTNAKERQLNLAAVIGLSLENLSSAAQQAFVRLTIFQPKPNSFSTDAAVQIADCSHEIFYELVDGGLVESLGHDRFALHQLIYDFGLPKVQDPAVPKALLSFTAAHVSTNRSAFSQLQLEQNNIQTSLELALQMQKIDQVGSILFMVLDFLIDRGQVEQASRWVEAGLAIAESNRFEPAKAHLLYCRGRIAVQQNQPDCALADLDQAAQLGQVNGLTDAMLRSQVAAMQINLRKGKLAEAEAQVAAVQHKIAESDDAVWQGKANQSLCGFYYFQGRYQQAFEHISITRQRFESAGYTAGMGAVYQNFGVLALELGRLDSAAANYERALDHYRTAGNQNFEGQILNNMGILAVRKGQWLKGLKLHQQAFELRQEIDDQDGQGQSLNNLSVVALAQKDVVQAQIYIEKGMALAKAAGARFREASLNMSRSTLATIQRDYPSGLAYAQIAHGIATELERESTLSEATTEQGKLYMFLGELDVAEKWLLTGREMCKSKDLTHQLTMNNVYLAKLCTLQADLVKAQHYLEEALVYLDGSIDGLDDPVEILQMCSDVLDKLHDEKRASIYKQKAIVTLKQQSLEIEDLTVREFFVSSYQINPQ